MGEKRWGRTSHVFFSGSFFLKSSLYDVRRDELRGVQSNKRVRVERSEVWSSEPRLQTNVFGRLRWGADNAVAVGQRGGDGEVGVGGVRGPVQGTSDGGRGQDHVRGVRQVVPRAGDGDEHADVSADASVRRRDSGGGRDQDGAEGAERNGFVSVGGDDVFVEAAARKGPSGADTVRGQRGADDVHHGAELVRGVRVRGGERAEGQVRGGARRADGGHADNAGGARRVRGDDLLRWAGGVVGARGADGEGDAGGRAAEKREIAREPERGVPPGVQQRRDDGGVRGGPKGDMDDGEAAQSRSVGAAKHWVGGAARVWLAELPDSDSGNGPVENAGDGEGEFGGEGAGRRVVFVAARPAAGVAVGGAVVVWEGGERAAGVWAAGGDEVHAGLAAGEDVRRGGGVEAVWGEMPGFFVLVGGRDVAAADEQGERLHQDGHDAAGGDEEREREVGRALSERGGVAGDGFWDADGGAGQVRSVGKERGVAEGVRERGQEGGCGGEGAGRGGEEDGAQGEGVAGGGRRGEPDGAAAGEGLEGGERPVPREGVDVAGGGGGGGGGGSGGISEKKTKLEL